MNTIVSRVDKNADGSLTATLNDGTVMETDAILMAIGRKPKTENLGLEEVGVELSAKGAIKVNDDFQTNVPSIYALGDVIDRVALTPVAIAEGMVFAHNTYAGENRRMKRALADRRNWLAEGFASTIPISDIHSPERVAALMSNYNPAQATRPPGLSAQAAQIPEVISGTGFVVLDRSGMGVACNLTQFNTFGSGRIAGDTGIILAAAPGLRGRNPLSLSPVMGKVLNLPAGDRLEATLATSGLAVMRGAAIIRVHDVAENVKLVRMTEAMLKSGDELVGRERPSA